MIKKWIKEHKSFIYYFLISCFVTVLDISTAFVLERVLNFVYNYGISSAALIANACGIIVGFIVQYILLTRKVYAGSSPKTFIIFFATWLLGFVFAELIIYFIRTIIFLNAEGFLYFMIAKFFSIIFPFFLTYFLRKWLIPAKETEHNE